MAGARLCSVEGCGRPSRGRGPLCKAHAHRLRMYGDVRSAEPIGAYTTARRTRLAEASRARMADPGVRARVAAGNRAASADPEVRARNAETRRAEWAADPERRVRQSERAAERRADSAGLFGRVWWSGRRDGRVRTRWPEHPAASPTGAVLRSRAVLYDLIGPGPHPCAGGCGRLLSWDRRPPDPTALTVDHIDHDVTNDEPANLRPLCKECNSREGGGYRSSRGGGA